MGLIIAAPTTALLYMLRNIPVKLGGFLKHCFTFSVKFKSDVDEYYYINKIVSEEIINPRLLRKFSYDDIRLWNEDSSQQEKLFRGLNVGYGTHWGSWKGTPCVVTRQLDEDNQTNVFKETLTISFIGLSSNTIVDFIEYSKAKIDAQALSDKLTVRVSGGGFWNKTSKLSKRPLTSVFTNDNQGQRLVDHILAFDEREHLTKTKGIPWRTGILLTGEPGTGKTSLIHALASETGRNIAILNLSALENDAELIELMSKNIAWEKTLLVLEDIDAASVATDREDIGSKVSLSTLLNMLDGITTPEGIVTVATTNHPDKLDPALIRAGRFDEVVELGPLEWEQFIAMVKLLRPEEVDQFQNLKPHFVPTVGAVLRKWLLEENYEFIQDKFLS